MAMLPLLAVRRVNKMNRVTYFCRVLVAKRFLSWTHLELQVGWLSD